MRFGRPMCPNWRQLLQSRLLVLTDAIAVAIFFLFSAALASATTRSLDLSTSVTVPANAADYKVLFAKYDAALNDGQGVSNVDNAEGYLAWLQSYQMLAYMRMYKATRDTHWLDQVANQFARVLESRDDRLQRNDVYTSTALKGWGTSSYDKRGWHVFVVHTGMICQGPAEFVRAVSSDPKLKADYGSTATLFLNELETIVADADRYFVKGSNGEGWYTDPGMGIVPLNMSNAMGSVLVELYHVTGKDAYRTKAEALATYFRHCLRDNGDGGWNWSYWPKTSDEKISRGEDISHAALNVDFAGRCADANIVFSRDDMERFGRTWMRKVRRSNGTWSGYVDGTPAAKPEAYIPQAAGRWLSIMPYLSGYSAHPFYDDVERAFAGTALELPSRALGIANLVLFEPHT